MNRRCCDASMQMQTCAQQNQNNDYILLAHNFLGNYLVISLVAEVLIFSYRSALTKRDYIKI